MSSSLKGSLGKPPTSPRPVIIDEQGHDEDSPQELQLDTEPEVLPEVPESAHEDTTDQVIIEEANPPQQADPLAS